LSKYEGIPLPGNITFNGQRIYQEAMDEVAKIEEDVLLKYQEPPEFITG
jgi:Fe-S cluster assembly ATPase SufC